MLQQEFRVTGGDLKKQVARCGSRRGRPVVRMCVDKHRNRQWFVDELLSSVEMRTEEKKIFGKSKITFICVLRDGRRFAAEAKGTAAFNLLDSALSASDVSAVGELPSPIQTSGTKVVATGLVGVLGAAMWLLGTNQGQVAEEEPLPVKASVEAADSAAERAPSTLTPEQGRQFCEGIVEQIQRYDGESHDFEECVSHPEAYFDKVTRANQQISQRVVENKQRRAAEAKSDPLAWSACTEAVRQRSKFPSKADFDLWSVSRSGTTDGRTIITGNVGLMNGLGLTVPHRFHCTYAAGEVIDMKISN